MNSSEEKNDLIIGRNAIMETLKSGREIDTLYVAKGDRSGSIGKIISICRDKNIVIKEVDIRKLDFMCAQGNHQGVAAYVAAHNYASVDDIFELAKSRNEKPFIIMCDEIEDPHNLGAIIRTAEAAGAHGIIVPKRHSASLSFAVSKSSAGALEYVPVARVSNLCATIDDLKSRGVWIYGTDLQGDPWCQTDLKDSIALVIGSEGQGLSRLVKEKCDFIISIPMKGQINSLNASVAAGVIMLEVSRQRAGIKTV